MEAIQAVARTVKAGVGAEVRREGMTSPMFWYLHQIVVDGPITIGQLAEVCGVTSANASLVTDDLVQAGLIGRTRSPQDRRVVMVEATSKGRSLDRTLWTRVTERMIGGLRGLDEREIAVTVRVLTRLAAPEAGMATQVEASP